MSWFPPSKDHLPLTWYKQTPIYLAAVIALGGVASMVFTSLLMALNPAWIAPLFFTVNHLLSGWIWTPVTYVLVNPPSFFFLITSYLLWNFGESIERHLGRWSFVKLLISLVLVSPVLLSILSPFGSRDWPAMGMTDLEFGVFLAFAALYPTAQINIIILTLEARVLAIAIVAVNVLLCLAGHNWAGIFLLAGQVATAVGYIRYEQGRLQLPSFELWTRRKKEQAKPKLQVYNPEKRSSNKPKVVDVKESHEDIDAILDKISRQGMASLTAEEKQALEKASERLGKKGR